MEGAREVRHNKVLIPPDMPVKKIMEKHNVCNSTAFNARKRGYLIENSTKNEVIIDRDNFDVNQTYKIALKVFGKSFSWKYKMAKELQEDLIQEAVTRQFELSGKTKANGKYNQHYQKYWIAYNGMLSFLMKYIRQTRYLVPVEDLLAAKNVEADKSTLFCSHDTNYDFAEG